MLRLIFTLDYEIHGNGEGCPRRLMIEPTDRLVELFDQFGAKLTVMADIGEILRFKEYCEREGRDEFHYHGIVQQLQRLVRNGHDVQLHIHSSYFNAEPRNGRWLQDWSEYDFASLGLERMTEMVRLGKEFLETIIRPVAPEYRCQAFRAANWSVNPSHRVVTALVRNGIQLDTSIFKFGRRNGLVSFDYTSARHSFLPWRASEEDLCREDTEGPLWEFPIYTEERSLFAFLAPNRLYRVWLGRFHKVAEEPSGLARRRASKGLHGLGLVKRHAWKADFNQCSGRQLVQSLIRAEKEVPPDAHAPLVLIGHSKLFNRWNAISLKPLLSFVYRHSDRFAFGTFADFSDQLNTSTGMRHQTTTCCRE